MESSEDFWKNGVDESEDFVAQVQEKSKNLGSLAKRIKAREIEQRLEVFFEKCNGSQHQQILSGKMGFRLENELDQSTTSNEKFGEASLSLQRSSSRCDPRGNERRSSEHRMSQEEEEDGESSMDSAVQELRSGITQAVHRLSSMEKGKQVKENERSSSNNKNNRVQKPTQPNNSSPFKE